MKRSTLNKFGDLSRYIALRTSVIAAMFFAVYFATEYYLLDCVQRFMSGKDSNAALAGLLVLFIAYLLGYLLASRRKYSEIGGALSVVSVVALFVLCQNAIGLTLRPFVFALAGPAVMHLVSVVFYRAAENRVDATPIEAKADPQVSPPQTEDNLGYSEQELVVGAA